jgi:hypothetical protein
MAKGRSEYDKKIDGPMYTPNEHLPKWHDAVELDSCQLEECPSNPNEPWCEKEPGKSSPESTEE